MCDGHAGVAKRAVREAEANEGKGTPSQAKRKRMDNQVTIVFVPEPGMIKCRRKTRTGEPSVHGIFSKSSSSKDVDVKKTILI